MLIDIKREIDNNTTVIGVFNTPPMSIATSSRQKINEETLALTVTLELMILIDIYRIFHLKAPEYTLFSSAHGTLSRTDHVLGYKTSVCKFKI